jgi:hypothetical protein
MNSQFLFNEEFRISNNRKKSLVLFCYQTIGTTTVKKVKKKI